MYIGARTTMPSESLPVAISSEKFSLGLRMTAVCVIALAQLSFGV